MNPIAVAIISKHTIKDSYFSFLEKEKSCIKNSSTTPTSKDIQKFTKITDILKLHSKFDLKIELIQNNRTLFVRLRKTDPFACYKIFNINENLNVIKKYINKSYFVNKNKIKLKQGSYNLVAGRYSEKLVHEWISHPAEDNLSIDKNFKVKNNQFENQKSTNRFSFITYDGEAVIKLPENWLYLRYVNKGSYSPIEKKVYLSVKEAFMKKDGLIQSVCQFNCSLNLSDLNSHFEGVISKHTKYSAGYLCTKNNETVYGNVNSGYVLFNNIMITLIQ